MLKLNRKKLWILTYFIENIGDVCGNLGLTICYDNNLDFVHAFAEKFYNEELTNSDSDLKIIANLRYWLNDFVKDGIMTKRPLRNHYLEAPQEPKWQNAYRLNFTDKDIEEAKKNMQSIEKWCYSGK